MTPKKLALYALLAAVMLYLAGGEVLLATVLQYLFSFLQSLLTLIVNSVVGLAHILGLNA